MHHAGMNNFMAIDIHILTNRKKSYSHVGNGFISEKKTRMKSFIPTIWQIAPSVLPKWLLVLN